ELPVSAIVLIKISSIPKTSSGKIQRHACRDGYLAGTLAALATWSAETASVVVAPTLRRRERLDESPVWVEEGESTSEVADAASSVLLNGAGASFEAVERPSVVK